MSERQQVRVVVRPIQWWPDEPTRHRERSRFRASNRADRTLLERECRLLGAREVVIQLAVREHEIRVDRSYPLASARPEHPGVIVSFESRHGPLRYSTDRFTDWQDNLRAIALGLEALRKVDRYGIGRGGEQYRGWSALPPGRPVGPVMTVEEAARLLAAESGAADPDGVQAELVRGVGVAETYRAAVKRAHPDAGGDPDVFRRLTEARDLLSPPVPYEEAP